MLRNTIESLLKRSARTYLKRHSPYLIGITGSVGKTSARMIIDRCLREYCPDSKVYTSSKNFNSEIGMPLSILGIGDWPVKASLLHIWIVVQAVRRGRIGGSRYDVGVLEYGIDGVGDMETLLSIAVPDIGILTAIDLVHVEKFSSPDEILKEKIKLLQAATSVALYPEHLTAAVEPYLRGLVVDTLSFALGFEKGTADIGWTKRTLQKDEFDKPTATVTIAQGSDDIVTVTTSMSGSNEHSYIALGVELSMIVANALGHKTLEDVTYLPSAVQPGRFGIFKGLYGSLLVDSTYNASPSSMKAAIQQVVELRSAVYHSYDCIYCLGDMKELGEYAAGEHKKLALLVSQSADQVCLVGPLMKEYLMPELLAVGYNEANIMWFEDSRALATVLPELVAGRERRSIILFKGSQTPIYMEEALLPMLDNIKEQGCLVRQSPSRKQVKQTFYRSQL